jgi:hypothetical protein
MKILQEMKMKGIPTQKQGNIARPVKTSGGFRPDRSGDGVSPFIERPVKRK